MRDYMLCFACSYLGEPGCGCPDNDFYHSEKYKGMLDLAEKKAEGINRNSFRGDFVWWVEDLSGKVLSEGGRRTKDSIDEKLR